MFARISKFLHYWYFRYLMVTELYMVEKWERAISNIFFLTLLGLLTYFNCAITLSLTSHFTSDLFGNSADLTIEEKVEKMNNLFSPDVTLLSGDIDM